MHVIKSTRLPPPYFSLFIFRGKYTWGEPGNEATVDEL